MKNHPTFILSIILFSFFLTSCAHKAEPIAYGKDQCDNCKMGISDAKFGAELVSKKGKIFKFDSDECMIHYYIENESTQKDWAMILVADFAKPNTLIDALKATFIQSDKISSPMGENIASVENKAEALKITNDQEIFSWEQMLQRLKR